MLHGRCEKEEFRVGEWLVQPDLGRISRSTELVHLQPLVMDLLVFMAHHDGEVLHRRQMMDEVWPQTIITEAALNRTVSQLRKALGDHRDNPEYVETITKRGYRLIAPVSELDRKSGGGTRAVSCEGMLVIDEERLRFNDGTYVLGRAPDCDFELTLPRVSRRHARFTLDQCRAWIEDLGSKNGTFLNGNPVESKVEVFSGDTIRLGRASLKYHLISLAPTETDLTQ